MMVSSHHQAIDEGMSWEDVNVLVHYDGGTAGQPSGSEETMGESS